MNNGTPCVYVEPSHRVTHEQASENSAQNIPGEDTSFVFHVGNKSEHFCPKAAQYRVLSSLPNSGFCLRRALVHSCFARTRLALCWLVQHGFDGILEVMYLSTKPELE